MSVTSQQITQVAAMGSGLQASSQLVLQAAYFPPATIGIGQAQTILQTALIEEGLQGTSQAVMLVAYRTGAVTNLNLRSWQYSLDGHTFYVLTLGEQGTYAYDQTSGQWAKWQTAGLPGWNMELGTMWRNRIIACDQANPIIWELDPNSFLDDDFKVQTRTVTGGFPLRQRNFPANYAFRVTASLGTPDVPLTEPVTAPTIRLRTSDDQGKTFTDAGTVTIGSLDYTQEIAWLALGSMRAPGRIFEITDTGAVARIDGADAEIEGNE